MYPYTKHIEQDASVCGGAPVIKGTRVLLRTVLASLEEGATFEEILRDFPALSEADIRAAIAFAAVSAREDLPVPAVPIIGLSQTRIFPCVWWMLWQAWVMTCTRQWMKA